MRKYSRKRMMLLIFITFMIILIPVKVQAVGLQANKEGTSLVSTTANDFFDSIRQMEDEHGTLGTPEKEGGNGIDCHMAKNTEWGTAAMLSASRYGTVQNGNDGTTTGNKSGVYQMANNYWEYVAGVGGEKMNGIAKIWDAAVKYRNLYGNLIQGDSYNVTNNWYSASDVIGLKSWGDATRCIILRGGSQKLFNQQAISTSGNAGTDRASRAVVVCGSGL